MNFAVLENCFFEIGDTMVQVNSEIGPLKKVMLHRPGNELKRVHPFHLPEMLFEDTPLLEKAQAEHDTFAGILRENGVEILYQEDMFAQAMKNESERSAFVEEFLDRSAIPSIGLRDRLAEYYNGLPLDEFVERVYTGVLKSEFDGGDSLGAVTYLDDLFLVNPLPNSYFTRDSSINIADDVILSHMGKPYRQREPLLMKYIHRAADEYRDNPTQDFCSMELPYGIEGGDVLILSDKVVCIGCTERTQPGAIEFVAANLFKKGFEAVYAFEMERGRNAMHLDGMLTMVDRDAFLFNPFLSGNVNVYKLTPASDGVRMQPVGSDWSKVLADALGESSVRLIPVGNGDEIQGFWEMWNLGGNVLTLAPGLVVCYDRNKITLDLLDKAGIEVRTFEGAELSRGRGGARCMSMPIIREAL